MKSLIAVLVLFASQAFAITPAEQAKIVLDVGNTAPMSLLANISRDLRGGACTNVGLLTAAIDSLKNDKAIQAAASKINPWSTRNMLAMEKSAGALMKDYCQTNKLNKKQALELANDIVGTAAME